MVIHFGGYCKFGGLIVSFSLLALPYRNSTDINKGKLIHHMKII